MVALCQIHRPGSGRRAYFDRKVAEGRTKREARRSPKRHVANLARTSPSQWRLNDIRPVLSSER